MTTTRTDHPQCHQMNTLQARVMELEQKIRCLWLMGASVPAASLNPAVLPMTRFIGKVVADHQDGTYLLRRQIAAGPNAFCDDPDHPDEVTAGNVAERSGYLGLLAVDDIVTARLDGLDGQGQAIYHIY